MSISDTGANSYVRAGMPKQVWADGYSAKVVYAENVRGGRTSISARFARPISFGILYANEYSGVEPLHPLDTSSARTGRGRALDSGSISTAQSNDLLFAAGGSVGRIAAGAKGFSVRSTASGNLVEDRVAPARGSYRATAVHGGGDWVMQVSAFKPRRGPGGPASASVATTSASNSVSSSASSSSTSSAPPPSSSSASSAPATSSSSSSSAPTSSPATSSTPPATSTAASGATCAYPTPQCTGVPSGTSFVKTVNGDYTVTTPGQVIDRWHITGDLTIAADHVTVTNSQIDGTVDNEVGSTHYLPFSISDSTIGPANGCIGLPGVGEDGFTATRVLVRGHEDGFRVSGSDITVKDSYAVLCYLTPQQDPPDGSHSDGIQAYCPTGPCTNVVFEHNTVDAHQVPSTNSVNLTDKNLADVTVTNNLLMGGAYVIDAYWHSGSTWVVDNNRIVDNSWAYGSVSTEGTCGKQSWSGNSVVTVNGSYDITSTVAAQPCVQ